MKSTVPQHGLSYVRQYVRGGSTKCWCGQPKRKVGNSRGRYCLECHARDARLRRTRAPKPKKVRPIAVKIAQARPPRFRRPYGLVLSKINVRAAVAPVMPALDSLFQQAEAYPLGDKLAAWLDLRVSPLVNPMGVGYRFVWSVDGSSKHLLFNLRNFSNRIIIP